RHHIVQYHLGCALGDVGRLADATAPFQQAIRLKKDFPDAYHGLGLVYAKQGKFAQAIRELREAVRLEPDDMVFHNDLGGALAQDGQTDEAIVQYEKALALEPNGALTCKNLARCLVLHPDPKRRDAKRAVELAERAVQLEKGRIAYLSTLA